MTRIVPLTAVLLLLVVGSVSAQANPFTGSGRADRPAAEETSPAFGAAVEGAASLSQGQPLFPRLNALLREQQRALNARIAQLLRGSATQPASQPPNRPDGYSGRGILIIGLAAFLYGLIHAALPGHRKVLLVAYFASTRAPLRHAVAAGIAVAALHSGAAALVILGGYFVMQTSLSAALDRATLYMQAGTAALVLLIGCVVLIAKIREALLLRRHGNPGHSHGHGHSHDHRREPAQGETGAVARLRRRIGLLPAIVLSSVVPCPGSAMILLFALSLGVVWLGIYATFVFSIGMAVTLTAVSGAAVITKRAVTGVLDGTLGEALHIGMEGLGGLAMVAFGTLALLPLL